MNGIEPEASRWSPEVEAYNDFPAIAQRAAEREAQREAEGAASREAWAALTPAEQEAQIAAAEAAEEAHIDQRRAELEEDIELYRQIDGPEAEIG